jgi:pyruvate formate lyase activating enzyme
MKIGNIVVSSLEYPGHISLVIFTAGCVLRCPYCHNPEIVEGGKYLENNEILKIIRNSMDFIDSVVITGGEPLIQHKDIKDILNYCKKYKLKTKIDTNGCFPERLEELVKLIDYVALDVKAPFDKYEEVIGSDVGENVKKSMKICLNAKDTYLECRTTFVPSLLSHKDILKIAKNVNCDVYSIQQFRNRIVLDERLSEVQNPSNDELKKIAKVIKPFMRKVKIKTAEFGDEDI